MRFRKADYELIEALDSVVDDIVDGTVPSLSKQQQKAWSSFYERVQKAAMKPKNSGGGLSVREAVTVLQGVLGRRLVLPAGFPRCGQVWFIQLQNRINASGLTAELVAKAGKEADKQWRNGRIKFESIIRQADTLLADVRLDEESGESTPGDYVPDQMQEL